MRFAEGLQALGKAITCLVFSIIGIAVIVLIVISLWQS